jgi:hypothetical protein
MQECQTLFPLRLGALRLGASEGFTHKYEYGRNLQIMAYQVAAAYEADVDHAHLTVISSCNVNTHQGKYYSDKSEYARSGVDLPNRIH